MLGCFVLSDTAMNIQPFHSWPSRCVCFENITRRSNYHAKNYSVKYTGEICHWKESSILSLGQQSSMLCLQTWGSRCESEQDKGHINFNWSKVRWWSEIHPLNHSEGLRKHPVKQRDKLVPLEQWTSAVILNMHCCEQRRSLSLSRHGFAFPGNCFLRVNLSVPFVLALEFVFNKL